MKRLRTVTFAMGTCLAALIAGPVRADTNPFIGNWHWNPGQSTLPPDEPPPTDLRTEISRRDNNRLAWSVTVLTPDGQSHVETFDAAIDGKFQPVSGDTTASFRLAGNTLQAMFKGPSGQSDALTCSVSPDQQRLTCNGTVNNGDGRTIHYVDVYDRR